MTILITGSAGKTASRLTSQLRAAGHAVLVASRSATGTASADGTPVVRFDWLDAATHASPFAHPAAAASPIRAVFIVLPTPNDAMCEAAKSFVTLARSRGAARFVLLSSSAVEAGGPLMGGLHAWLAAGGDAAASTSGSASASASGLEWAVLRPSWFMENFSEGQHQRAGIVKDNAIFSAAGDGRVPFVACEDIAAVAAAALTAEQAPNRDYLITGPELWTYDQAAACFTEVLGREIRHVKLDRDGLADRLVAIGAPRAFATVLASLDVDIAGGAEDRLADDVERATGRKPLGLREWIGRNKQVWMEK